MNPSDIVVKFLIVSKVEFEKFSAVFVPLNLVEPSLGKFELVSAEKVHRLANPSCRWNLEVNDFDAFDP